ncbi:HlyD family efflux transporter periplasmic adaptor subunit [Evtepia sp.]|uniref:HlyD family efflux transporter periplasmic adaptor subunit n=1 Tax=Evtepia sp. TaxID=2773933 RepID=UPI002A7597C8|nr:HlyD family efflux transporter periplasmic adaptor subunit [Evtepia sp.]
MKKQGTIFSKIVVPGIIVVIVAYFIISAWIGIRNPYPTTAAYTDTISEGVAAEGWVVREELPVESGQGLVQLKRNQGEKVGKGQEIGVVYQDEQYVEKQEELLQVRSDLGCLQYATYEGSPSGVVLEDQMLSAMDSLREYASSGNFTNLSDRADNYRKLVLRREYLLSSDAAAKMDQAAVTLTQQYEALQSSQTGATTITAAEGGMFYSNLDGYETLLTPEKLENLSPSDLAHWRELAPLSDGNYLGRLVTSATWYYAVVVPGEYSSKFTIGKSVDVYFDSLFQTLTMQVKSVGEVQEGRVVVVLQSSKDIGRADTLRQESGRVVFSSSEGIRVPKEALRVNEDGEAGVYIVSGYKARFRPVKILAEDETGYLVAANNNGAEDTRVLRAGDEVILATAELTDGKVVR